MALDNFFERPVPGTTQNFLDLHVDSWAIIDNGGNRVPIHVDGDNLNTLDNFDFIAATWSGCVASPVAGNIRYSQASKIVSLNIPAMSFTTNSSNKLTSQVALPATIAPAVARNVIVIVFDGTNTVPAKATINTDGTITIGKDLAGNNFGNGVNAQVISTDVCYNIT